MASTINKVYGDAPSRPPRVIQATADLTAVTSYVSGGVTDAVIAPVLAKLGTNYTSIQQPSHNGTTTRWFKVDAATGKIKAYTTASLEAEVAGGTNLSLYTAVPVFVVGS